MTKEEIRKLQNHFNAGKKEGYQAKVHYSVNDKVHLKGTNVNGVVTGVIFKEDRSYPYLKIKWNNVPVNYETQEKIEKKFYDPFDVVKEIKRQHKEKKQNKKYYNFYIDVMRNKNAED